MQHLDYFPVTYPKVKNMKKFTLLLICLLTGFSSILNAQNLLKYRLDSLTNEYQKANFNGVILIGKNGQIIYQNAFGYANLEKKIPMTVDKLFKTESVGKMFTSTRIMQLYENGEIKLNKTISDYLPDWKVKNADKITIHHLLNHTSGLMSTWDDPKYDFKKAYTTAELKAMIEAQPLAFEEPGLRFHYSNSGYIILGEIIARIDGKPFDQAIRERIFNVAGMKKINHLNDTVMPASAAQPYFFYSSKDYIQSNQAVSPKAGAPGGWITNAEELLKFLQTYIKGTYINANTKKIQQTANNTEDLSKKGWHFGYGFLTLTDDVATEETIIGHNGGGAGFSIDAFFEPKSGYSVVMCSNMYGTGYHITGNYFNILFNKPIKKVEPNELIRFVDLLQQKGTDYLIKQTDAFFNELKIQPSPPILINVSENLEQIRDLKSAGEVLSVAQRLFPEIPYVWLNSGNVAFNLKKYPDARVFYEKTLNIAQKEKNDFVIQQVNQKLDEINKLKL